MPLLALILACVGAPEGPATPAATPPGPDPASPAPVAPPPPAAVPSPIPTTSTQLLLVRTAGWDAVTGTLGTWRRTPSGWAEEGGSRPVVVGRTGLGWGRGLHPGGLEGPVKQEGDGRAPAGVFPLGPAMGYSDGPPAGTTWPYRTSAEGAVCVDDPASAAYNHIAGPDTPHDWRSAEVLTRKDLLYRWLVLVGHNGLVGDAPPVPGGGSCIFLHVWRAADKGTDGCTAAAEPDLVGLLGWLDPAAGPVLVQLPESAWSAVHLAWGLP